MFTNVPANIDTNTFRLLPISNHTHVEDCKLSKKDVISQNSQ